MTGEIQYVVDDPYFDTLILGDWIKDTFIERILVMSSTDSQKALKWIKYELYNL